MQIGSGAMERFLEGEKRNNTRWPLREVNHDRCEHTVGDVLRASLKGLEVTGKWGLYTYLNGVSQACCAPAMLPGKLIVFRSQEAFD